MRFYKLCLLVLVFSFLVSTVALAEEIPSQEEVMEIKKLRLSKTEKEKVRFFYLLGGAGYARYDSTMGALDANHNPLKSNYVDGFAVNLLGGWQVNKYFAMEAGVDYIQVEYISLNFKYTILAQPYIEIDKSWSIMPKVGVGFALIGMFTEVVHTDSPAQGGFGFDFYGVVGLRGNYKKLIFGVSYEHNVIGSTNNFMVTAEAGVKF